MADPKPYYAEAFTVWFGRCFRFVGRPKAGGQPTQCPAPAVWRGIFTAEQADATRSTPVKATLPISTAANRFIKPTRRLAAL